MKAQDHALHPVTFIDYQLRRLVGCGFADPSKLISATATHRRFSDMADALSDLAQAAEGQGALREATAYQRGVEFFTDPETPARRMAYDDFQCLFRRAYASEGWTRVTVPYGHAALPAYRLPARGLGRGVVLLHGGFDSLIEEFVRVWVELAHAGFDVVAFEGPGQGGARLVGGLPFDHHWERPVTAVLDHFRVERASLVGMSMGGWWSLRAAAFEPRIHRVVSWPPVYDWLAPLSSVSRALVHGMIRWRSAMNPLIRLRMRLFPVLKHAVRHAMYITKGDEPMDAVDWLLGMNAEALQSERITQDVLLMVGEGDTFQPPRLAEFQKRALVHARSVQLRRFTWEEGAARHCQLDNLPLACKVLSEWLGLGAR